MLIEIFFYTAQNENGCAAIKVPESLYVTILNAIDFKFPPKQPLKLKISDYSRAIKNRLQATISELSSLVTAKESWNTETNFELKQAINLLLLFTEEEYSYFSF